MTASVDVFEYEPLSPAGQVRQDYIHVASFFPFLILSSSFLLLILYTLRALPLYRRPFSLILSLVLFFSSFLLFLLPSRLLFPSLLSSLSLTSRLILKHLSLSYIICLLSFRFWFTFRFSFNFRYYSFITFLFLPFTNFFFIHQLPPSLIFLSTFSSQLSLLSLSPFLLSNSFYISHSPSLSLSLLLFYLLSQFSRSFLPQASDITKKSLSEYRNS